ncbi:hypothetical protein Tco_0469887, partial [Tanacetum coccineum]
GGCFTERITDFTGRFVKDADKDIIQAVKARTEKGRLVSPTLLIHIRFVEELERLSGEKVICLSFFTQPYSCSQFYFLFHL